MGLRVGAALLGLLGGLAWIAVLVLDRTSATAGSIDATGWAGLALLTLATLGAGSGLVGRKAAPALRLVVALGFTALVGSLLALLIESYDEPVVLAGFGAVACVVSAVVLLRPRPPSGGHVDTHRSGGAHAR